MEVDSGLSFGLGFFCKIIYFGFHVFCKVSPTTTGKIKKFINVKGKAGLRYHKAESMKMASSC